MPKEKRTSQRRGNTSPKVLDPDRILEGDLITAQNDLEQDKIERNRLQNRLSKRRVRSMSTQQLREMAADEAYRYVIPAVHTIGMMAIGEIPADSRRLQACNTLVDRVLPRLQGIAVQGAVEHKIEWSWKDDSTG